MLMRAQKTDAMEEGYVGRIFGLLKRTSSSFVSLDTPPSTSQGHQADTEQQNLLEENVQYRIELEHLMQQLDEERSRGDKLQSELSQSEHTVQAERKNHRTETQKAITDLQIARAIAHRHRSNQDTSQEERTRLMTELQEAGDFRSKLEGKIHQLEHENGQITKRLRIALANEAKASASAQISLDAYDNTLDQISEAQVKISGHPSVNGLNDSLDNLVNTALERVAERIEAYTGDRFVFKEAPTNLVPQLLLNALAMADLTEDNRGLLLDVSLHHVIVGQLYTAFFRGEVASAAIKDAEILEQVFYHISNNGAP